MKIIESISKAMNMVAMGVLAAMMLLTVADVSLRYVFSRPITGATEITEFMIVLVGFLGLAWCAVKGAHLKVDSLVSHFSPRLQAITDSFTYLIGLAICVIIGWRSFMEGVDLKRLNVVTSLLEVPVSPFYIVLALGFAVLSLVMVAQLIQYIAKAVKG
jgi:TRAP-type C4-dicarboxylate transport system permease small subunit